MTPIRSSSLAALLFAAILPFAACDSGDATPERAPEPNEPLPAEPEPKPPEPKPAATEPSEAQGTDPGTEAEKPEGTEPAEDPTAATGDGEKNADGTKEEQAKPDGKKSGGSKPKPKPDPEIDAKGLYMAKCKKCHGATGDSNTKMGKKHEIDPLKGAKISKKKAGKAIRKGVPDTKMKPFESKLSGDEIDALAAYVAKL